jgi:membrane protein implicated in regulation of membrane protease activity
MVELTLQSIGYGLIMLGIVLFLLEAASPGFFIAVPATILVLLGAFALVSPDFSIFTAWAPAVALVVGVPATILTILAYRRMAPPDEEPTTQTASNLVGLEGRVTTPVVAEAPRGKVELNHQSWSAVTRGPAIPVDARVVVTEVDGVILIVRPKEESA